MKTHEFSIIASGSTLDGDDFDARLYDNGGDDAIVSFQKGHLIIDFAREADTLQSAIASAMQDVARSGGNVERVEARPIGELGGNCCADRHQSFGDQPILEWTAGE